MKLIIACPTLTTSRGGAERVAAWLANSLTRLGHEVSVYARSGQHERPAYHLDKGVALKFYPLLVFFDEIEALRKELVAEKADVCIVFYWNDELAHWVAALDGTGIPLVSSERNAPEAIELSQWSRPGRLSALSGADVIHLLLQDYVASLPQKLQEKTTVIGNPVVDIRPGAPAPDRGRARKLMCASRLEPKKQQDLLIDAFYLVHEKFKDWELDIWGSGSLKKKLRKKIAEYKLEGRVHLRGLCADIEAEYATADIYCISSRYEGFPNVLLEAMSRGLPCVGLAGCPGVNVLIKDGFNGFLAPEASAQSLADKLSLLMDDPELLRRMSENAVNSVQEYREEVILDKWVAMLQKASGIRPTKLQRLKGRPLDYESHLAVLLEETDLISARRLKKHQKQRPSPRKRCSAAIRKALRAVKRVFIKGKDDY
ncbi:glycosyltransferase family 4 protein [Desulfovibrio sp. OttesenSCG-928-A18]|nr:glycosyltransferase family 4 protein [Desulfovibrio sp. OttesenSCG-928-A18]